MVVPWLRLHPVTVTCMSAALGSSEPSSWGKMVVLGFVGRLLLKAMAQQQESKMLRLRIAHLHKPKIDFIASGQLFSVRERLVLFCKVLIPHIET